MASLKRLLISILVLLACCLDNNRALSQNPPAEALKAANIIAYLKDTIDWYHGTVVEQQIADDVPTRNAP